MIRIKKYGKGYNVETRGYGYWIGVPSATSVALKIVKFPSFNGATTLQNALRNISDDLLRNTLNDLLRNTLNDQNRKKG